MKQPKRSKRPVNLTANGKATVLEGAATPQRSLDIAAHLDSKEGVRQGLEDAKRGKIRPAKEFFQECEAKRGL